MAVTEKIRALLSVRGKKNVELAEDLIKIADFAGVALAFEVNGTQKIMLESSDIR